MISMREAIAPTGTWVVYDVGTASDEGGAVADSDWTDVFIYNPSSTAIDVSWILGGLMPAESGQHSATGGGILPLRWKTRVSSTMHLRLRASGPICVAAYRGRGAGRYALVAHSLPTL